jgi:hypothetical protein
MANDSKKANSSSEDISCYLTDDERRNLVTSLHDILAWIGMQPPDEFEIDKNL